MTTPLPCVPLTQGRYADADPLYIRAIKIWEAEFGPEHPNVAAALSNRAGLLQSQASSALFFWLTSEGPYK